MWDGQGQGAAGDGMRHQRAAWSARRVRSARAGSVGAWVRIGRRSRQAGGLHMRRKRAACMCVPWPGAVKMYSAA